MANMNTLQLGRIRKLAIETYKILYNMSPVYIRDLVNFRYDSVGFVAFYYCFIIWLVLFSV